MNPQPISRPIASPILIICLKVKFNEQEYKVCKRKAKPRPTYTSSAGDDNQETTAPPTKKAKGGTQGPRGSLSRGPDDIYIGVLSHEPSVPAYVASDNVFRPKVYMQDIGEGMTLTHLCNNNTNGFVAIEKVLLNSAVLQQSGFNFGHLDLSDKTNRLQKTRLVTAYCRKVRGDAKGGVKTKEVSAKSCATVKMKQSSQPKINPVDPATHLQEARAAIRKQEADLTRAKDRIKQLREQISNQQKPILPTLEVIDGKLFDREGGWSINPGLLLSRPDQLYGWAGKQWAEVTTLRELNVMVPGAGSGGSIEIGGDYYTKLVDDDGSAVLVHEDGRVVTINGEKFFERIVMREHTSS